MKVSKGLNVATRQPSIYDLEKEIMDEFKSLSEYDEDNKAQLSFVYQSFPDAKKFGSSFSVFKRSQRKLKPKIEKTFMGFRSPEKVKLFIQRLYTGDTILEAINESGVTESKAVRIIQKYLNHAKEMGFETNFDLSKIAPLGLAKTTIRRGGSIKKLNEESVIEIKKQLHSGASISGISKRFMVTTSTIASIRDRQTWKHI